MMMMMMKVENLFYLFVSKLPGLEELVDRVARGHVVDKILGKHWLEHSWLKALLEVGAKYKRFQC